jgi:T5SS/PEP-CTERM-associated repeat protein
MSYLINYSGKGQVGNLSDPNNWVGGVVPGSNNMALITMDVGGPISGTYKVGNMMLLGSEKITFTGTLNTTGALNLCYGLYVCDGAVAAFAPGAVLNDAGVLVVGIDATGTFLAEGSGTKHSVINSAVGKLGLMDDGVGTVTIDNSTWNNSGEVVIGYRGKGTLNVTNGGSVHIGGNVWMENYTGSSGSINISSGGSVSVGGILAVGVAGSTSIASVSVGSGSSLTVRGELVADAGIITIDNGIWNDTQGAVIGFSGKGTVNVINGGSVSVGGSVELGLGAGSNGKLNIASGGSVHLGGILWVGANGNTAASTGSVTVGAGSSLTTNNLLFVNKGSELDIAGGTVTGGVTTNTINVVNGGLISGFGSLAAPGSTPIQDNGVIRATGGTLAITGNIGGPGSLQIDANSTATLTAAKIGLGSIAFIGPNATLALAHGATVSSAVTGFTLGDMISMANITAVSFTASTGVLKLMDNAVVAGSLHMVGNFSGETFAVHASGGTNIVALHT